MVKAGLAALALLSLIVQPVLGDGVFQQDGRRLEGVIVEITDSTVLQRGELADGGVLEVETPKSEVTLALYAVNESALAQAGNALIRARNLFFIGTGIQVAGILISPLFGFSAPLVAIGASVVGGVMQLMAFWNVGVAGAYLIQASR